MPRTPSRPRDRGIRTHHALPSASRSPAAASPFRGRSASGCPLRDSNARRRPRRAACAASEAARAAVRGRASRGAGGTCRALSRAVPDCRERRAARAPCGRPPPPWQRPRQRERPRLAHMMSSVPIPQESPQPQPQRHPPRQRSSVNARTMSMCRRFHKPYTEPRVALLSAEAPRPEHLRSTVSPPSDSDVRADVVAPDRTRVGDEWFTWYNATNP